MRGVKHTATSCSVANCAASPRARGYCEMHYRRWQRHGDATVAQTPPTWNPSRRGKTTADAENGCEMHELRAGELFAGYNGLGMAVEEVFNAETAWFSEFESAPSKILAHQYPYTPNHGDVTKIKWTPDCPECGTRLALYRVGADAHRAYWCSAHGEFDLSIRFNDPEAHLIPEPVDIISGGSPCQDLSLAGKRRGMTEGTRSNLWESMREGIATIKPKYVVWENVRGALSAGAVSEMEQSEGHLGAAGNPNLRALGRVLGDLADLGLDAEWRGIRAADVGAPHGRFRIFILATHRDCPGLQITRHPGIAHPESISQGPAPIGNKIPAPNLTNSDHTNWGAYAPAIKRWERTNGPAPRPTEHSGRGLMRLSPSFAEWMMGLTPGWVTAVPGVSRADQLKACGNGVVPQQATAALRDMLAAFNTKEMAA